MQSDHSDADKSYTLTESESDSISEDAVWKLVLSKDR